MPQRNVIHVRNKHIRAKLPARAKPATAKHTAEGEVREASQPIPIAPSPVSPTAHPVFSPSSDDTLSHGSVLSMHPAGLQDVVLTGFEDFLGYGKPAQVRDAPDVDAVGIASVDEQGSQAANSPQPSSEHGEASQENMDVNKQSVLQYITTKLEACFSRYTPTGFVRIYHGFQYIIVRITSVIVVPVIDSVSCVCHRRDRSDLDSTTSLTAQFLQTQPGELYNTSESPRQTHPAYGTFPTSEPTVKTHSRHASLKAQFESEQNGATGGLTVRDMIVAERQGIDWQANLTPVQRMNAKMELEPWLAAELDASLW